MDRSGSMSLYNRMELAIEAMELFIRSLPPGCKFSIISFGSNFDSLCYEDSDTLTCEEKSRNYAIDKVKTFEADYGGTEILQPLAYSQIMGDDSLKKRIFLLTDGCVSDKNKVIDQARQYNDKVKVFTFGLGSGCDK